MNNLHIAALIIAAACTRASDVLSGLGKRPKATIICCMHFETAAPTWWQRLVHRAAALRPVAWAGLPLLPRLDRLALRLSKGATTLSAVLGGLPVVELTALGAKSGKPRTVPLLTFPRGEGNLLVVASNWGRTGNPDWYHNLKANPELTVTYNGESAPYTARELVGAEREQSWQAAVSAYPGYAAYEKRAGRRLIPLFLLSPGEEDV